jgi:poly(3-hydroxybutyrate) depolymerase
VKGKIVLLAGKPNDANRDYLPEAIKGSKMVVNENGNNSQVYPERLIEHHGYITDDSVEDTWYEYVPATYDPGKKTPLVFSMHGGLMTGWGQAIYTSWTHVADREGFICVFPNASDNRMWMIECDPQKIDEITKPAPKGFPTLNRPTGEVEDFHDVKFVRALLALMKEKYNIDEGRVYMQGMSMGNVMTSQVVRYCGKLFAGAAGSGCPTNSCLLFTPNGKVINKGGALDIWQSRLEHDKTPPHYGEDDRTVVLNNIKYWRMVNEAYGLPQIRINGEKNLAFFKGKKANVTLMDVKNRDHGQTFDDAEMAWDYMFSGVRKNEDGSLTHSETICGNDGDSFAIAIAEHNARAWVNNKIVSTGAETLRWEKLKYHGLNGGQIMRGSYLCVPLGFIAEIFGATLDLLESGAAALLTLPSGRTFQFAEGCIGCVVDNKIESMLCEAIYHNDSLYISMEWFCRFAYNYQVSEFDNVMYITDHYAEISRYISWLLQDMLSDSPKYMEYKEEK